MSSSLIQIHYHNLPGGVNRVIENIFDVFGELYNIKNKDNKILICSKKIKETKNSNFKVVNIDDCFYSTFNNKQKFLSLKKRIFDSIKEVILNNHISQPIYIIGHNLNLGKNCALSAAFAECARFFENDYKNIKFYSIIHDFAEEGRIELIRQIKLLDKNGIKIWDLLYPSYKNVIYIALNKYNYSILKKAGFNVLFVPNPLFNIKDTQSEENDIWGIKKNLKAIFGNKPLIFYPSRVISRKNHIEAIIISQFLLNSNLLIGNAGTSENDKELFRALKKICNQYRLSVFFNAEKKIKQFYNFKKDNFYPLLYKISDACISSSILEGFGYSLYEPFLYGKNVIFRLIQKTDKNLTKYYSCFYKKLLIPIEWIDVKKIARLYYEKIKECFYSNNKGIDDFEKFENNFKKYFIEKNGIDFGCLDINTQYAILECLCKKPQIFTLWKNIFFKQMNMFNNKFDTAINRKKRLLLSVKRNVLPLYSKRSFKNFLLRCFKQKNIKRGENNYFIIMKEMLNLKTFRILISPHFNPKKHFCKNFS
jgi:hypothetical protein